MENLEHYGIAILDDITQQMHGNINTMNSISYLHFLLCHTTNNQLFQLNTHTLRWQYICATPKMQEFEFVFFQSDVYLVPRIVDAPVVMYKLQSKYLHQVRFPHAPHVVGVCGILACEQEMIIMDCQMVVHVFSASSCTTYKPNALVMQQDDDLLYKGTICKMSSEKLLLCAIREASTHYEMLEFDMQTSCWSKAKFANACPTLVASTATVFALSTYTLLACCLDEPNMYMLDARTMQWQRYKLASAIPNNTMIVECIYCPPLLNDEQAPSSLLLYTNNTLVRCFLRAGERTKRQLWSCTGKGAALTDITIQTC